MLNHVKKGMERTYDLYEMEDEKRLWFLKWEEEVAAIAVRVGVAAALGVPRLQAPVGYSFSVRVANRSTAHLQAAARLRCRLENFPSQCQNHFHAGDRIASEDDWHAG
jgi:hypothetical protein